MEPMRRRKTRQRRSKRRLRRDGLALQQRTRDLAASTVRSMVDVLDTVVDKESLRTGYNYLSGGVRGVMVTIVTAAIVMVGLPLEPILSSVDKPTWRRITSYFQAVWSTLCIGLINPVHLIKSGEFPDSSTKPKILICNHVTDVDWVYMWILAQRTPGDRSGDVKIIMKDEMKQVPLYGQGMTLFDFLFLRRKWDVDKNVIKQAIKRYTSVDAPVWIIMFPEGVTINTKSVVKSLNWAKSRDHAPELKHTLLPRARGFQHVLNLFQEYGASPEVFDISMNWDGYSGEIPTWEMGYSRKRDKMIPNFANMLSGVCTERCHMNSEKFSYDDVASHPQGVEGWLTERWVRKDELMEQFIESQRFPGDQVDDYDDDSLGKILQAGPILLAALTEIIVLTSILSAILLR